MRGDFVTSLCFCFPTHAFFLWQCTCDFEWITLLGVFLAMGTEFVVLQAAGQAQRFDGLIELNNWLAAFPHVEFVKRSLPEYGVSASAQRMLGRGFGMGGMKIEVYQVVCPNSPLPGAVKAFAFGATCIVFVRDAPGNLKPYGRFLIYHELGHAYPLTPAYSTIRHATVQSIALFAVAAIALPKWTWIGVIALVAYSLARSVFFFGSRSYQMAEQSADQFAACFLKDEVDLKRVAYLMEKFEGDDRSIRKRTVYLREIADDPSKCPSPDLPVIPASAAYIPYAAIGISGTSWDHTFVSVVIYTMLGVAAMQYVLMCFRAKRNNRKHLELVLYIDRRQSEWLRKMGDLFERKDA